MAYDLFEREYREQIEWRAEQLMDDVSEGDYEEAYDAAYEQAIDEVAADNGITLV